MEKIKSPTLMYFADYIEKEVGILYGQENAYQLENRLLEICKSLNIPSLDALLEKVKNEGLFGLSKDLLLDTATNNETSFFRDPKIFKAFEKFIVPECMKNLKKIKTWSVASSFGQEPYSLAMILQQLADEKLVPADSSIYTTDVSHKALKRVNEGTYSHLEVQRGLSASYLIKYFDKVDGDSWQLKPAIRAKVQSKHMNLLSVSGVPGPFQVIFCRNVLIYQTEIKKREIVENLSRHLETGGFFVMGAAESLYGLSDRFNQVVAEGAVFYQKK